MFPGRILNIHLVLAVTVATTPAVASVNDSEYSRPSYFATGVHDYQIETGNPNNTKTVNTQTDTVQSGGGA